MKQSVIRDLSTTELKDKLSEETGNLRKLTVSHAVSSIENPLKIRETRRTIARIRTELKKREINEQNS